MVRLNRRVGYNRDTYLLCRLCDRVVMIPEQVRRKLDAGQGHIVGQVAVHFPVELVGQIRAAQVEAGSQRGKGQVLLQMQVDIVDDIADDHRIASGRVPRHPVTILLQHLDHKGLLLLLGGRSDPAERREKRCAGCDSVRYIPSYRAGRGTDAGI